MSTPRIIPILLIALGGQSLPACTSTTEAPPVAITTEFALRDSFRALWIDHVALTRFYLIAAIAELPSADAAAARLLENQVSLGDAIQPYYGSAAAAGLTALLREHITIAVQIVAAAKGNDALRLAEAKTRWTTNSDAIATFLAAANPNWPVADLKAMMQMHLDQTLAEATARLDGNWAADVLAYQTVSAHILEMADTLSAGITKQFPLKVSVTAMSGKNQDLRRAMRALWTEHVTWTRLYLISTLADLPDADAASVRLMQNQVDLGNALKPYYGVDVGAGLTDLLHDHISLAAEIIAAAKAGDEATLRGSQQRWNANADAIATFLAGSNPAWAVLDLRNMMHMHLDLTSAELTSRLTKDWAADTAAYDKVTLHARTMADTLSSGIALQFPGSF